MPPVRAAVTYMRPARILPEEVDAVNRDKGHKRTQAERSAATRAALLVAARRLFTERGFAATGREDIAAAAGVTRGALYDGDVDGDLQPLCA